MILQVVSLNLIWLRELKAGEALGTLRSLATHALVQTTSRTADSCPLGAVRKDVFFARDTDENKENM